MTAESQLRVTSLLSDFMFYELLRPQCYVVITLTELKRTPAGGIMNVRLLSTIKFYLCVNFDSQVVMQTY